MRFRSTTLLALLATTLACAAAADAARPNKAGGPNKADGPTSRPARDPDKLFKRLDTDHDGVLSKAEFEAFAKRAAERRDRNGKGDAATGDGLFAKLDADKDGFLSPEEFKKLADLRHEGGKGHSRRGEPTT